MAGDSLVEGVLVDWVRTQPTPEPRLPVSWLSAEEEAGELQRLQRNPGSAHPGSDHPDTGRPDHDPRHPDHRPEPHPYRPSPATPHGSGTAAATVTAGAGPAAGVVG